MHSSVNQSEYNRDDDKNKRSINKNKTSVNFTVLFIFYNDLRFLSTIFSAVYNIIVTIT